MVGNNLSEKQLQEIVDKTILYADKDGDGKISYVEFCSVSYLRNNPIMSNYSTLLGCWWIGCCVQDGH